MYSTAALLHVLTPCGVLPPFAQVYVDIPGAINLSLNLPLVIGTIPLHPFGSRTSSVSSQCSMSWLGMGLPERPEGELDFTVTIPIDDSILHRSPFEF